MEINLESEKRINKFRRCYWTISGSPKKQLHTPCVMFVMSPWGNQLYKLSMFLKDWGNDINLLVSLFDLLHIRGKNLVKFQELGFSKYLAWIRQRYRLYVMKKRNQKPQYNDYLDNFSGNYHFSGITVLDSGGFSFRFENDFSRLPILNFPPKEKTKNLAKAVFLEQIKFKPTVMITLDKPIIDHSMSEREKKSRYLFSIKSAIEYLHLKGQNVSQNIEVPLLWGAVHFYGPSPKRIDSLSIKKYRLTVEKYVSRLIDSEERIGVCFDGFSVGSLVPIKNKDIIREIARGVIDVLKERGRNNVPIHGLGVSRKKLKVLLHEGFDVFDSNLPMKMGRSKRYYDPTVKDFLSIDSINYLRCSCKICKNYEIDNLKERRKGLKEVSTVLLALHNHYSFFRNLGVE